MTMKEKVTERTNPLRLYLFRVLTAMSVLLNVILGGANNQTFSARNYEWKKKGKLNIVGREHCLESWVYWKTRRKW